MIKKIIFSSLLLPGLIFAFAEKSDFEFFKEINNVKIGEINYLNIDADIESKSKKYLGDIRIFSKDKEEKYFIRKEKDLYNVQEKKIFLDIINKNKNVYIIDLKKDLKEDDYLNQIFIKTNSNGFRRLVNIQGSDLKKGPYFNLNIQGKRGDLIYDLPEGRDFSIEFKYSNYKYLKLTFSGDEGIFREDGFYRIKKTTNTIKGDKYFFETKGKETNSEENNQKIILDTGKENLFFDEMEVVFEDEKFDRNYILYSSNSDNAEILKSNNRFNPEKNYWTKISTGYFKKEIYLGNPKITLKNNKRFYRLDILNGDNEKLKYKKTIFSKFKKKIYFKPNSKNLKIFYSSNKVKKPDYDFNLSNRELKNAKEVELSIEKKNSDFIQEKKSIFDDNKYLIYLLVWVIIFILAFFVYKILKETGGKTDRDGMQI